MSQISFFTPVIYGNQAQSSKEKALEKMDQFFDFCGKRAIVISPGLKEEGVERVFLSSNKLTAKLFFKMVGVAISFFSIIVPLAFLIAKAILRSSHQYKVVDLKKELEGDLQVAPALLTKIQTLIPAILKKKNTDQIEYLKDIKVFKLKEAPNLVFKLAISSKNSKVLYKGKFLDEATIMEHRFENMILAKEVCLINHLDRLVIPPSQKFTFNTPEGKKCVLIVEKSMRINPEESVQEELYYKNADKLNEVVQQLSVFIAKTGFNDVTPRNIPLMEEEQGKPLEVALFDLEHMENATQGFIGGLNGSRGLIYCVSEKQVDLAADEARKYGVKIPANEIERAKKQHVLENKIRQHYKNKEIVTGKEPLNVDIDSLELDWTQKAELSSGKNVVSVTIREAAADVIKKINELLLKSSDDHSIKRKRYVLIDTHEFPFNEYANLGVPKEKIFIDNEDKKKFWLYQILDALIKKGHIFRFHENGYGYFVQA